MQKLLLATLLLSCIAGIVSFKATPPYKVIYVDWRNVNYNNPGQTILGAVDAGFNVVILAFYLTGGPTDMAQVWGGLDNASQASVMQQVHAKGAMVMVAQGGATDSPYSANPTDLGTRVAQWAIANHLDGVDFDLENLSPGFAAWGMSDAQTIQWFVEVTNASRAVLGSTRAISHAPQAPYFGPKGGNAWTGPTGGYTSIEQQTDIDFYNVQFYNQGAQCYTDYAGTFQTSCSTFPSTSVGEIVAAGVPLHKIVLGKPVTGSDASNGYLEASAINAMIKTARTEMGWNAGIMGWQWGDPQTLSTWVQTCMAE